jgi:hypothetical protein
VGGARDILVVLVMSERVAKGSGPNTMPRVAAESRSGDLPPRGAVLERVHPQEWWLFGDGATIPSRSIAEGRGRPGKGGT